MLGNPPYSVSSNNKSAWILKLLEDYKRDLKEKNIQPLSDDYIKFIRLGQYFIETNEKGVLAFISNNSFLDGLIHRKMRSKLLQCFDKIYIVDLHGNSRKNETSPDGSPDENVFNIMAGVSINIFVKTSANKKASEKAENACQVFHTDLYGARNKKFDFLNQNNISGIQWTELDLASPNYFFVPKDFSSQDEYESGFKVDELFTIYSNGVETGRDSLFIDFSKQEMENKISKVFKNKELLKTEYGIKETPSCRIIKNFEKAKKDLSKIQKISYRPFDFQYIYYDSEILRRSFSKVMKNFMLDDDNFSICTSRQLSTFDFQHIFISQSIVERCFVSMQTKETTYVFPLYLYETNSLEGKSRVPNLDTSIVSEIAQRIGCTFAPDCEEADLSTDARDDRLLPCASLGSVFIMNRHLPERIFDDARRVVADT